MAALNDLWKNTHFLRPEQIYKEDKRFVHQVK